MQNYLLSAAGVIFLSVIVSLIIPEGKLNKTIVFVMRLACIFVLIQPIKGIFGLNSGNTGDLADYTYVEQVYSKNQSGQLKKIIGEKFLSDCECTVQVEYSDGKFSVTGAAVALNEKDWEINDKIYEYLKELGYINISVYAKTS